VSGIMHNVINKNSKAMEEQILKIGTHLKEGTITDREAKNALLILFGVSNRRELLISFKDFYNKKMEEYALHCGIDIALIDEFERNL
jgi:hypothetical protein